MKTVTNDIAIETRGGSIAILLTHKFRGEDEHPWAITDPGNGRRSSAADCRTRGPVDSLE